MKGDKLDVRFQFTETRYVNVTKKKQTKWINNMKTSFKRFDKGYRQKSTKEQSKW